MRVLLVALCVAVGALCVPAGAFAWDGGGGDHGVHQSNRNTQVTVVRNGSTQCASLLVTACNVTVPINVGVGLNLNDVLNGIGVLGNGSSVTNQ